MKAIEVARIGERNCKPATVIPVPAGMDATVFLALFLDDHMMDGYTVVNSYGNANTFGLSKRGGVLQPCVLRIRLIEMEAVEARQSA